MSCDELKVMQERGSISDIEEQSIPGCVGLKHMTRGCRIVPMYLYLLLHSS